MKRVLSLALAVVFLFTLILSGCGSKQDPYTSEHTVSVLSTAIRTLSDSAFTDLTLIKAIYNHAFSSTSAFSSFPQKIEETLPNLFSGEADEALINATVAYGGTAASETKVGELSPTTSWEQQQFHVGDLLFINHNSTYTYYIYDKDGLVNLSAPLEKVDTPAVLTSLPNCAQFAVFRPLYNMASMDLVAGKLPKMKLTEAQQAVVATAQSFLLRGDKLQYTSLADGLGSSYYIGVNSPEDHTSDNYGSIQCSGFCYDVYYQALGMKLKYEDNLLNSSGNMRKYSPKLNIQKYLMQCKKAAEYTEEDKKRISQEIMDLLEPGDILVVDRTSGGHVMLYVGNGNIIHANGSNYNKATYTETYEATIRQMRFSDYFFTEGTYGYLFGSDTGKKVTEFLVIRPLDIFDGEIPEVTKNRIKYLQGVMVQKLSSHNLSLTANVGEEITYTFEIYNQNNKEVTLAVSDVVPAKSEYVSGADTVNGDTLSWEVTIPANTRKTVSYVVKVAADAKKGDIIVSESGLVGGVPANCPGVTVGNSLSREEREKLKKVINEYQPSTEESGFDTVNAIYKEAFGWDPIFEKTDFDEIYQGKNGVFKQVIEGTRSWLEVNSNSTYSQMVAPNLTGGHGTKEGKHGHPVLMPSKEQQFVVGDILICDSFDGESLYLYAGDGVIFDLLDNFTIDKRTVQGRIEAFMPTNLAYTVLRPSLMH